MLCNHFVTWMVQGDATASFCRKWEVAKLQVWEIDLLPLLVLTCRGAVPVKTSTHQWGFWVLLSFPSDRSIFSAFVGGHKSEAWGPPQFQEKRSRSEKAILGALGAFRGILGATLGIRNSILGIQNSILGMASHDLSNTKTTILGATPGAIPGVDGNPHEIFSFAPSILGAFFRELGWSPRARIKILTTVEFEIIT